MTKRNTQLRRHAIIQQVNQDGEVSVEMLTKRFQISEVTIRKDLTALEASGLLLRRYGGAIAMPQEILSEDNLFNDDNLEKVSKRKIQMAQTAASLIQDHYRIIIDSGRTTAALIPQLNDKKGLVVMTNALQVATQLNALESEPTLLMTGGTWDAHSESFQGKVAENVLRSYDFDQLFIGADGIDLNRGTTTFNELLGLSQVMAEVAREVIVMVSSDKIERKIPNLELAWSNINTIVTDNEISQKQIKAIQAQGVRVITPKPHQKENLK